MESARQICRASSTVAATPILTACPVCGSKVKSTEKMWLTVEGERLQRPVVPSHVRSERGEATQRLRAETKKYPGTN